LFVVGCKGLWKGTALAVPSGIGYRRGFSR